MIRLRRKQLVLDDIKRIQINPGDALLFESNGPLAPEDAVRIKTTVEAALPGIKALVVCKRDFDIRVVSAAGIVSNPPPAPLADSEVRG